MHSLLARQLRRVFGSTPETLTVKWNAFLQMIDEAYHEFDRDRALLERSIDISSQELIQANRSLAASLKDVTERKRLEGLLFQSEKMAAVGQLAAGIAHEMNNPLGVILGFAQSLHGHIAAGNPLLKHVDHIEREAQRCKALIQRMLTLSRFQVVDEMAWVDLNTAVEESIALVLAKTKCAGVELIQQLEPNLPSIVGSRSQIQQVVINLCSNAIDAMPKGGCLKVSTQSRRDDRGAWQILTVADTGKGIPTEIRSRIFDPFFTTKEVGEGTGIGLSMVYEIIRRHKGDITVESTVGVGSEFKVFWPAVSTVRIPTAA